MWAGVGDRRARWDRMQGASEDCHNDEGREDQVFADGVGHKRHAFFMNFGVFRIVGRFADRFARRRVLVDALAQDQPEVDTHQRNDEAGNHEHVQREKPRKRFAGDNRPA